MIRLNRTHSFLNLQQNFSNKIFHSRFVLWQNSSELRKFHAIRPHSPQIIVNSLYIMFQVPAPAENSQEFQRIMQIPRSPRITQNSRHLLTHYTLCFRYLPRQRTLRNSSELRKFRAVHPHSPRITRNSHHLLTYYILYFRCLTSGRELPKIPANQAKFAQFAHISHELHKFCTFRTKLHPYLVH